MKRWIPVAAALALALSLPQTHAAGGGGGGAGSDTATVQDPDYQAAMAAVKKSDWPEVVAKMTAYTQRVPGNADAWNELGHASRKLGDLDNAFKHYAVALKIDPKHRDAHEYLGEAYLQANDLPRAEEQLRILDKLCFLPCEQHTDLKEEIRKYKAAHPSVASK